MKRARVLAIAGTVVALTAGCALGGTRGNQPAQSMPEQVMPAALTGYQIVAQPTLAARLSRPIAERLITKGEVYIVRSGATVEGSVEVTLFRRGVNGQDLSVQAGIEKGLGVGGGGFQTLHFGLVRLLVAQIGEQQIYLWFPAEHNVMELFVMRKGFAGAGALVRTIVADQLSLDPAKTVGANV
jgi:hypothetical protein